MNTMLESFQARVKRLNLQSTWVPHFPIGISPRSGLIVKVLGFIVCRPQGVEATEKTKLSELFYNGSHLSVSWTYFLDGGRGTPFVRHLCGRSDCREQDELDRVYEAIFEYRDFVTNLWLEDEQNRLENILCGEHALLSPLFVEKWDGVAYIIVVNC